MDTPYVTVPEIGVRVNGSALCAQAFILTYPSYDGRTWELPLDRSRNCGAAVPTLACEWLGGRKFMALANSSSVTKHRGSVACSPWDSVMDAMSCAAQG